VTRLLYLANARIPTEKAHGLQIMQNCEAFAEVGADVTLWAARRINPGGRGVDPWAHYGVARNFRLRRLPCIDMHPLVPERTDLFAKLVFFLQLGTYALAALIGVLFTRADIYYSRDALTLLLLSLVRPKRALAYEAHKFAPTGRGRALQTLLLCRVGSVIAITPSLRDDLIGLGADPARVIVAHDGVRAARFADLPDRDAARQALGWPVDALIVGYVGRLHTLAMDKGVGTLVDALAGIEGAALGLVGGPDDMAAALRARWIGHGLPPERFLYAGQVPPDAVPRYLRAFDVCAMPHPYTPQFARATSPLKLFEYMAAGRAIVASDLPGWADVIHDGETVLLVPPGDVDALAAALERLRTDPAGRDRLGAAARAHVLAHYTWASRARTILNFMTEGAP
jgi:glycosyltransferase involved in cell wall biosynthesis